MIDRRMDCAEIRDVLLAGSAPAGPDVEAHLHDCAPCTELLRDHGTLGRALSRSAAPGSGDAELWTSVETALAAETGLRAWIRSRASRVRLLIAVVTAAVMVVLGSRASGGTGPAELPIVWVVAFALVVLVGLAGLVAPLGRTQPAPGKRWALIGGALSLPLVHALASQARLQAADAASELGFVEQAVGCFAYGVFLALPFLVVVWLLERDDRPWLTWLAAMGAIAGLVANAALALHCPNTAPAHLAVGHATIGIAFALLGALWALADHRRARRGSRPTH